MTKKLFNKFYLSLILVATTNTAFARENWQFGFSESVTTVMDDVVHLHDKIILPIIVAISAFVLFLLIYSLINDLDHLKTQFPQKLLIIH